MHKRSVLLALIVLALTLPQAPVAHALPQDGYEITYYQWNAQHQIYTAIGQQYWYCWMYRSQSWGDTTVSGSGDCGIMKREILYNCDTDEQETLTWYWNGLNWSTVNACAL